MRTIHKAQLNGGVTALSMPTGAKVLTAQYQNYNLCIWYECDDQNPMERRTFAMMGTGWPIPEPEFLSYVATVQSDQFVWHIHEILR